MAATIDEFDTNFNSRLTTRVNERMRPGEDLILPQSHRLALILNEAKEVIEGLIASGIHPEHDIHPDQVDQALNILEFFITTRNTYSFSSRGMVMHLFTAPTQGQLADLERQMRSHLDTQSTSFGFRGRELVRRTPELRYVRPDSPLWNILSRPQPVDIQPSHVFAAVDWGSLSEQVAQVDRNIVQALMQPQPVRESQEEELSRRVEDVLSELRARGITFDIDNVRRLVEHAREGTALGQAIYGRSYSRNQDSQRQPVMPVDPEVQRHMSEERHMQSYEQAGLMMPLGVSRDPNADRLLLDHRAFWRYFHFNVEAGFSLPVTSAAGLYEWVRAHLLTRVGHNPSEEATRAINDTMFRIASQLSQQKHPSIADREIMEAVIHNLHLACPCESLRALARTGRAVNFGRMYGMTGERAFRTITTHEMDFSEIEQRVLAQMRNGGGVGYTPPGTVTGRLSSREPQAQGIPRTTRARYPPGVIVRDGFITIGGLALRNHFHVHSFDDGFQRTFRNADNLASFVGNHLYTASRSRVSRELQGAISRMCSALHRMEWPQAEDQTYVLDMVHRLFRDTPCPCQSAQEAERAREAQLAQEQAAAVNTRRTRVEMQGDFIDGMLGSTPREIRTLFEQYGRSYSGIRPAEGSVRRSAQIRVVPQEEFLRNARANGDARPENELIESYLAITGQVQREPPPHRRPHPQKKEEKKESAPNLEYSRKLDLD